MLKIILYKNKNVRLALMCKNESRKPKQQYYTPPPPEKRGTINGYKSVHIRSSITSFPIYNISLKVH